NGKPVGDPKTHHNHAFYGPGYPIAHPGIFPHNPDADRWSYQDWLKYDFRAGWGTDDFENMAADADKAFGTLGDAVKAGNASGGQKAVADLGPIGQQSKSPAAAPAYKALQNAAGQSGDAVTAAAGNLRKALGIDFPNEWADTDDRADARKVVDYNIDL